SIAVFTNNESGYRAARDLTQAGAHVEVVVDARKEVPPGDAGGAPVIMGNALVAVKGGKRVMAAVLADHRTISCDAVAMSGGWSPIVNLACHRGAKPHWNEAIAAFVPPDVGAGFMVAGSASGKMLLSECLADGA